VAVILTAWYCPDRRRKIWANLNSMITMLLGGLWHGASMNFLIWGGLNGVGMVVFKFWRDSPLWVRSLGSTVVVAVLWLLATYVPSPLWNLFLAYVSFIMLSAWIRWGYIRMGLPHWWGWLERSWCILVTFTFITFTRLFFRSGSNLDPAIANETAWNTATSMVTRIGSAWSGDVWEIVRAYSSVFTLFILGMVIHWLPEDWKRRYRIGFSRLPLPVMCLVCVIAVFAVYQFVTAKMQPFIYFQF